MAVRKHNSLNAVCGVLFCGGVQSLFQHENKVLNSYKEHLGKDEPTDLYNFTQQQAQIINNRNFINQGLNMSQAQLNASEHENKLKRQDFLKIKHNILGGIDKKPNMMNVTQEFVTTHTSGGR